LLSPLLDPITVVLNYEEIVSSGIGVAIKTTPSGSGYIDIATGITGDVIPHFRIKSTELLCPLLGSTAVKLDHEKDQYFQYWYCNQDHQKWIQSRKYFRQSH